MSNLSTLPKGDSAWLLRKSIERIIQQVSVLETNIGSSTTGNSSNTQIIFNDNGTLRGDAGLTYNKTTDLLTVGAATITGDLTVDTSTLKVDSANNRVGIGTASPSAYALHVSAPFASSKAGLLVEAGEFNQKTLVVNNSNSGVTSNLFEVQKVGTAQFLVDSSGNVGINTASPAVKLDVVDTVNTFAAKFRGNLGTNFVAIGTTALGASINGYTAGFAAAADLILQPNGGNVGIGATPSSRLDVANSGVPVVFSMTLTGVQRWQQIIDTSLGNWTLRDQTGSIDALIVRAGSGNLGIGVTPSYKLHVAGTGYFSSTLTLDGATRLAGAGSNSLNFNTNSVDRVTIDGSGNTIVTTTATAPSLGTARQMVFNLTSDTNLRISVRGTDGTTRTANITLA